MDNPSTQGNQSDRREQLMELREAMQQLHKALLTSERISYETSFGVTLSSYQFLQLLTNDSWFAWLAPVTHLLADMDVQLDEKKPLAAADVRALGQRAKSLLTPTETGEGFSRHFDEVLQRDPDVLFAHVTMAKLLRELSGKDSV
jgi:hypothetical protein